MVGVDSPTSRQRNGRRRHRETSLEKSLHMKHINTKEDIPRTTPKILQLLTALKHDEATSMLLEKGFGIKPPIFPENSIAGFSYNIFHDAPLPVTPFEIGQLHQTDFGFMVPTFLTCKLEQSSAQNFIFEENQQTYIRERWRSIGIEGQISPTLFKGTPKPGYNIGTLAFRNGSSVLSAQRAFKRFQFIVNERSRLNKEFVDAVKALPTFSENDHDAVIKWTNFFNMYGTHVVKSIHGGGAIEIQIQLRNNGPVNKEISKSIFSLINFIEDVTFFVGDNETSKDINGTLLKEGIDHTLVFSGGNYQYHTNDFTKLSIKDAVDMMSNWQKSLKYSPTLLTSEMKLIPISRVAKKIGSIYEQEIERVANIIYNTTLKYVPNSSSVETMITSAIPTPVQGISEQSQVPSPREFTTLTREFLWQEKPSPLHEALMSLKRTEAEYALRLQQLEQERQQWQEEMIFMQADITQQKLEVANIDDERREAAARRISSAERKLAEMYGKKQREWEDILMEQQKFLSASSDNVSKAIRSLPQPRGGSCLKAGTMIRMASGTQKPVELLEAGDIVVDKDLMPTSVLGVAHEFLLDQKFYGFDNRSYFFTNSHLFVGPKALDSDSDENFKVYVKSTENLYHNNPLLRYINVSAMPAYGNFELFHVENSSNDKFTSDKIVTVTEDPEVYPFDTPVYFIQVNSSTGTYIANDYICRHETPPFERWPNTMSILFRLIEMNAFEKVSRVSYNIETQIYLQNSINGTAEKVNQFFENIDWSNSCNESNYEVMTLGDVDVEECILKLFNNPTMSSAGIGFYAGVGQTIAMHLDEETEHKIDSAIVGKIQHELYQILRQEIENY